MSNKYPGGIITSGANSGYSVAFDGNGDYLTVPNNTAFDFGSGNFTIEFWVYRAAAVDFMPVEKTINGQFGSWYIDFYTATGQIKWNCSSTGSSNDMFNAVTFGTLPNLNTWYHVAVVRNGSAFTGYINGVGTSIGTSSSTIFNSSYGITIGAHNGSASYYLNGYLSNVRLLKGTALYTAAFTPPTQLLAITNTSLLTCNSPALVDQSSNNFTITANGNAAVSTFTPFQGYTAYNPALGAATPGIWTVSDAIQAAQTRRWNMYDPYFNYTTLLLHGNGTNGAQNNTFLDSSSNNFTITRNGNTTQGTFSPFSQTGWSNFFDGSSALTTPNNTAFDFGTGDFTVEAWVYFTSLSLTKYTFMGKWGSGLAWIFQTDATTKVGIALANSGVYTSGNYFSEAGLVTGQWMHLAVSRSGTTLRIFKNGVVIGTFTSSENITTTETFYIARNGGASQDFPGYISNARVVKGTAVYTTSFTPSAAPLTAVAGTSLLACQDNRFKDNSANNFTLTPSGSPSVQPFSPFYPVVAYTPQAQGGSGYFDGTTDFLTAPADAKWRFGSGDFTIEAYVYIGSGTSYNLAFHWNGTSSGTVTGTTAVRANSWNHVAVTRTGTTLNFWINGVGDASNPLTVSSTIYNNTDLLAIGKGADHTAGAGMDICHCGETGGVSNKWFFYLANSTVGSFVGFMSWFRISSSVRYTANFTPPSAPTTSDANTSLLLNFTNAGIVDSTAKNVLETVSSVQVSTTQSKFGGSSMWFQAGGTLAMANSPNLSFGTGDFTVEWWVYWNTVPTADVGFVSGSGSGSTDIRYNGTNLRLGRFLVAFDSTFAWTAATGQWYHVAVTRQGTSVRAFVNGTQIGTTSTNSNTYNAIGNFYVGTVTFGTPGDTPLAYIDDFRITKGYARYTGNFTPQTSQWQDQ